MVTQPPQPKAPGSEAFPEPSKAETIAARKQGVVDAIAESTKEAYMRGANEGYGDSDGNARIFQGTKDVFRLLPMLDLDVVELKKQLDGKTERPLSEAQIAGLLEAERSGKNRTEWVKVFCERLGIKSPYEATAAGPNYTNDTSSTAL